MYCDIHASRPASVSKTVPRPPAVSHFWVEKPSNSIKSDTAATHTAVYMALPANWNPICQQKQKYQNINKTETTNLIKIVVIGHTFLVLVASLVSMKKFCVC